MSAPLPGWYQDPSGGKRYWDGSQWLQIPPPTAAQTPVVINNMATTPVFIRRGPNHALHLILTILTCGLWLPVWILITIVDAASGSPMGRPNGRILAVVGGLFLFGVAVAHWQVFLMLAVFGGLGCAWYFGYYKPRTEQAEIAARADQAYLNDPPGFLYPPTVFDPPKNRHEKEDR